MLAAADRVLVVLVVVDGPNDGDGGGGGLCLLLGGISRCADVNTARR